MSNSGWKEFGPSYKTRYISNGFFACSSTVSQLGTDFGPRIGRVLNVARLQVSPQRPAVVEQPASASR